MTTTTAQYNVLGVGSVKLDGGVLFTTVPREEWEGDFKPDRKNRIKLDISSLLIRREDMTVLVNPGVGNIELPEHIEQKYGINTDHLSRGLREHGVSAKDIDAVILTSPRFYFSGGCIRTDRHGKLIQAFSQARYFVQKTAWDEALTTSELNSEFYFIDLRTLEEKGTLVLINGDDEILPGIHIESVDNGRHQNVYTSVGSERIRYVGDMFPTELHIDRPGCISAYCETPRVMLASKKEVLRRAEKDGERLIFGLSYGEKVGGYRENRNGGSSTRWIKLP